MWQKLDSSLQKDQHTSTQTLYINTTAQPNWPVIPISMNPQPMTHLSKEQQLHPLHISQTEQPQQQVVTNHGELPAVTQPCNKSFQHMQPSWQIATVYSATPQTHQTTEMDHHASDAENKDTWEIDVQGEYSATIAIVETTVTGHAENSETTHLAQSIATPPQVTVLQPYHFHWKTKPTDNISYIQQWALVPKPVWTEPNQIQHYSTHTAN